MDFLAHYARAPQGARVDIAYRTADPVRYYILLYSTGCIAGFLILAIATLVLHISQIVAVMFLGFSQAFLSWRGGQWDDFQRNAEARCQAMLDTVPHLGQFGDLFYPLVVLCIAPAVLGAALLFLWEATKFVYYRLESEEHLRAMGKTVH